MKSEKKPQTKTSTKTISRTPTMSCKEVYGTDATTPLLLEEISYSIEILSENMYKQSTTMTFKNYTNKKIEGELIFPLPENATICRFATKPYHATWMFVIISTRIVYQKKLKYP